jgi:hypothetical protein
MRWGKFSFGSIEIDGIHYEHDVLIDRGEIRKRKKTPSKKLRDAYGHTPLSLEEEIPWKCRRLVIGTGAYGSMPITDDLQKEAHHRQIELIVLPTAQAVATLEQSDSDTNAILHVTC